MNKLLFTASALILGGPLAAASVGIHPALPAFAGIACGIVAVCRGAQPLPDHSGAPSPGADADARAVGHATNYTCPSGIGIKDAGGGV